MRQISGRQFAIFRIALDAYLALHFAQLIPYGAELFSNQGMLAEARLNLTFGIFPNPLAYWDSPTCVTTFLAVLTLLSLAPWPREYFAEARHSFSGSAGPACSIATTLSLTHRSRTSGCSCF
jgi:hypothetical protein